MLLDEQGAPMNLGGVKGRDQTIIDRKHRNLKIGTKSRDRFSLCSG